MGIGSASKVQVVREVESFVGEVSCNLELEVLKAALGMLSVLDILNLIHR